MMKKNVFVGIGIAVAALLSLGVWLYSGSGSAYYYTQIDNSRIAEGTDSGFPQDRKTEREL